MCPVARHHEPFSLTLTLSRWEREQVSDDFKNGETQSLHIQPQVLAKCWLPFSLSQRERAGVRENIPN
jgi:hypothetical protein